MSTYTPIASQVLGSTTSSIRFVNIPQGYTDLVLVCTAISGDNNEALQFNDDTNSNYSWTRMYGDGTTYYSSQSSNDTYIRHTGGNLSTQNTVIINIQNYSNATTYKTTLGRGDNPSTLTMETIGLWRNTSPITTITYYVTANSFAVGSTFSLYGIQAGTPKAQGGQSVTTDGTYWYHTFTGSGTFIPSQALTVDYLVVAGGGAGGGYTGYAGGGGAGGLRCTVGATGGGGSLESPLSLTANTSYTVTVGAGGSGVGTATSGSNSVFGSITSTGGGYGGYYTGGANVSPASGGSGGGSRDGNGAAGTQYQGYAGGNYGSATTGGGGGAGALGSNAGGAGGVGVATSISGTSTYYAGGGGGTTQGQGGGAGGNGGGGAGGADSTIGGSGTANRGGGGGGSGGLASRGSNGGSGIVIVRYSV